MCKWGTTVPVVLWTAADLSHTGEAYWRTWEIDACIALLVQALQEGGINMRSSCCGHGKGDGEITLADGRVLIIKAAPPSPTPPKEGASSEELDFLDATREDGDK